MERIDRQWLRSGRSMPVGLDDFSDDRVDRQTLFHGACLQPDRQPRAYPH